MALTSTVPAWAKKIVRIGIWVLIVVSIVWTFTKYIPDIKKIALANRVSTSVKKEAVIMSSEFNLKPGVWSGPIIRPEERWHLDYYPERKIRIKIERNGKLVGECDMGGGLLKTVTPTSLPKDEIFLTSLDGEQVVTVKWVDRS